MSDSQLEKSIRDTMNVYNQLKQEYPELSASDAVSLTQTIILDSNSQEWLSILETI